MAESKAEAKVSGWVGWVLFAGVILMVTGAVQALYGLGALLNNSFLLVTSARAVVVDVTAWGWVHLIAGMLLILAGYSVTTGNAFGRIVAVVLTSLALVANMTYVTAYPIWTIMLITVNVLVLYALVVHGKDLRKS